MADNIPSSAPTVSANPAPLLAAIPPEARANPYPFYHSLRAIDPMMLLPIGLWIATRYAESEQILRDRRFATVDLRTMNSLPMSESVDALIGAQSNTMLFKDPPDHTRLRGLVSRAFTARMVNSLRPRIQEIADQLLADAAKRGEMDVISDFAYPLPVTVIAEMLGVPPSDRYKFREWSRDLAKTLDLMVDMAVVDRANDAMKACGEYLSTLFEERRKSPRNDLMSAMVQAEEQGDRLSDIELLANTVLLLAAGHETTMNLIGNGTVALLKNPDQMAKFKSEPSLADGAVEEFLRFDSPVQATARRIAEDVELGGKRLQKGQHVIVLIAAANRDPARFNDPDRLDIARGDNDHLAFGGGIHFCLGANLARAEAQIALSSLVRRLPELALRSDTVEWRDNFTLRGPKTLPVQF